MKASELMLGDLVLLYGEPIKVTATLLNMMSIDGDSKAIEPIWMSKKILAANGWDVEDSCYAWYKIDAHLELCLYWYEHRLTRHYKGIDEWQNHAKVNEITHRLNCLYHVHKFQHALRMMGMNEMADNFLIM